MANVCFCSGPKTACFKWKIIPSRARIMIGKKHTKTPQNAFGSPPPHQRAVKGRQKIALLAHFLSKDTGPVERVFVVAKPLKNDFFARFPWPSKHAIYPF